MAEVDSCEDQAIFLTLTYEDDLLARDLHYPHVQKFLRSLRKRVGKVRFFCCGEYGEHTLRAHWHLIIFGYYPDDAVAYDSTLFQSEIIDKCWAKGLALFGRVSFESAAYVARYSTKKVTGDLAESHYETCDPLTGEIYRRTPEFARMSLKPGIGADWYSRFGTDVYRDDFVISRGHPAKPPRYFDKLFQADFPEEFVRIQEERLNRYSTRIVASNEVREINARARLGLSKRRLE